METSKTLSGLLRKTVGMLALRQYIEGDMALEAAMQKTRAHDEIIDGSEEKKIKRRKKRAKGVAGITRRVTVAPYHSQAAGIEAIRRRSKWELRHARIVDDKGDDVVGFDRKMPGHLRAINAQNARVVVSSDPPPRHPSYAADRQGNPRFPPSQRGLA